MKLAIDVRGFSEEKKKRVQDAFFKLRIKWTLDATKYSHLHASRYGNVDADGYKSSSMVFGDEGEMHEAQLPHATTYKRLIELAGMDTSDPDAPQATNAPEPIATHHSQEVTLQEAIDATAALNDMYGEDAIHDHLQRLLDLQWGRLTSPTSAL